jgi:hypothetical protein
MIMQTMMANLVRTQLRRLVREQNRRHLGRLVLHELRVRLLPAARCRELVEQAHLAQVPEVAEALLALESAVRVAFERIEREAD